MTPSPQALAAAAALLDSFYIGRQDVSPDGTEWLPGSAREIASIIDRHFAAPKPTKP